MGAICVLALAARLASAQEFPVPEGYALCSADDDCAMAGAGCCYSWAAVNKKFLKDWEGLLSKWYAANCASGVCPAAVDSTRWEKLPGCAKGRCVLRPIEKEVECARVPDLYQNFCKERLADIASAGRCFACIAGDCRCPKDRVLFSNEKIPAKYCNDQNTRLEVGYEWPRPLIRSACAGKDQGGKPPEFLVTTCFERGKKTRQVGAFLQACPPPPAQPGRDRRDDDKSPDPLDLIKP